MNRQRYLVKVVWCFSVALLICGCVGKKPDDDVALIKQLLAKLERGVNQRSEAILDSIAQDKRQHIPSQLLDSLSAMGNLENVQIASKAFVIVKDSAEVKLRLGLRLSGEPEQIEKPLELFLHKKRGKWKIGNFNMAKDD
jgi:hypothetical protein